LSATTDKELVKNVKDGNRVAFSELVKRHQKPLFQFIIRYTRNENLAEDIVQDAFIRAYTKIHTFEERAAFKSWLYRIALNLAKNKLRREKPQYSIDNVKVGKVAEAESALVYETIQKRIQVEIDALPAKQKEALHLRVFEDLAFKEIAEIMDCPYDTAKANYRHALLKLKQTFGEDQALREWLNMINRELDVLETKLGVENERI
tara:strand:- start:9318 stop:9932 length:615 start_codon:yes stop_codon:yes gene_type:complete